MNILKKYKEAVRHTDISKQQADIFKAWKKSKSVLSVDTETTGVVFGLSTMLSHNDEVIEVPGPRVFGISLAVEVENIVHLFWARMGSQLFDEAVKLIKRQGPKVCHNARYDIRVLKESGMKLAPEVECTYTMSRIHWDRRKKHSLQAVTEVLCPELSDWEEPIKAEMRRLRGQYTRAGHPKHYVNYSFLPEELITPYAMTDAFMTLMLYQYLQKQAEW